MQVKSRDKIDDKYKWRLEDMIADDKEWQTLFDEVREEGKAIERFQGKLKDAQNILECLRADDSLSEKLERLYVYTKMRKDEDCSVEKYLAMSDRIENLCVELSALSAFVNPELSALDKEFLLDLSKREEFSDYSYTLVCIAKRKEHSLSTAEETILAKTGLFSGIFKDAFGMFDNLDIKFEPFKDSQGEEVKLSHGLYSLYMQSPSREDRKKAFESMFNAYKDMINTVSMLYIGNVKKNVFYTQVRKYQSCLDRATSSEDVPVAVYEKLTKCIDGALSGLHRYMSYRRKALGYKTLHMYDLHVPIVSGSEKAVEYPEACRLVKDALKPMGQEYAQLLDTTFCQSGI